MITINKNLLKASLYPKATKKILKYFLTKNKVKFKNNNHHSNNLKVNIKYFFILK